MADNQEGNVDKNRKKEQLIQTVQDYPELYDKSHSKYKDKFHAKDIWEKIATECHFSGKFINYKILKSCIFHDNDCITSIQMAKMHEKPGKIYSTLDVNTKMRKLQKVDKERRK